MGDRIGARPGGLRVVEDELDLVAYLDELGYESLWAPEGLQYSAFGKLQRWATVTDHARLATGIVNVYSRSPMTIAQEIATLHEHSGGRAILGLGVSTPEIVEGLHGVPYERPLPRVAEYIELVRRYLQGERVPYDGEFHTPNETTFFREFDFDPTAIPIYNAALGPDNVRLTGHLADGWLPNMYPVEYFERASDWLAEGASRAGRSPADVDVATYVLAAVADDRDRARRAAAEHLVHYLRDVPGYYDRAAVAAGYESVVEMIRAAGSAAEAIETVSADFVDAVAVTGTPSEARAQVADIRSVGVDLPIVRVPYNTADRGIVERTYETFAP